MYSNNIVNFQESTTISNACTKKSGNLLKALRDYKDICYIHKHYPNIIIQIILLPLSLYKYLHGPVNRCYRIHWLLIGRRVRLPKRVSCIWHKTIWLRGSSNAGALENAEYRFIAITPRFTLARSRSTWQGSIYRSNRTKLCTYTKLNFKK